MPVFCRLDRNPHGPSRLPVIAVALAAGQDAPKWTYHKKTAWRWHEIQKQIMALAEKSGF